MSTAIANIPKIYSREIKARNYRSCTEISWLQTASCHYSSRIKRRFYCLCETKGKSCTWSKNFLLFTVEGLSLKQLTLRPLIDRDWNYVT